MTPDGRLQGSARSAINPIQFCDRVRVLALALIAPKSREDKASLCMCVGVGKAVGAGESPGIRSDKTTPKNIQFAVCE